jgi:hypothetical protein
MLWWSSLGHSSVTQATVLANLMPRNDLVAKADAHLRLMVVSLLEGSIFHCLVMLQ